MRYFKKAVCLILTLVILLFSIAEAAKPLISSYSNGNIATQRYADGIFAAKSNGAGLFAIALYKSGELVEIKLSNNIDETATYNLNTVLTADSADYIKLFRLDEDGNPLCVSSKLIPGEESYRIYVNEDFSDNSSYNISGSNAAVADGKLTISGNGTESGVRAGIFHAYNCERYTVVEADYYLDSNDKASLICNYYGDFPREFICAKKGGIYTTTTSGAKLLYGADKIDYTKPVHVGLILDSDNFCYDAYINGDKINTEPLSMNNIVNPENPYEFSLYMPHMRSTSSEISVDNIRVYSANRFIDLGDRAANVHILDYSGDKLHSAVYGRPSAEALADKILKSSYPRVMINSDKLSEIKNSADETVIEWKAKILDIADATIDDTVYSYHKVAGDIMNLGPSAERVMALGLAFMLEGGREYAKRAYDEVNAIYTTYPNWGREVALDVGEISFISAICYDWLYDGLEKDERERIENSVMTNSIYPSYKRLHGINAGITTDSTKWWATDNNWNAICSAGAFIASVAFMECDSFVCANLAEASLRGLEAMLPRFAPAGAWAEGAMYWQYTMNFVTAMLSTLNANCDSFYGIENTAGFSKTMLYSLSMEGKTGLVNLGDSSTDRLNAPFMFYWSKIFNKPEYTSAAIYIKKDFGFSVNAFDLIYYSPSMDKSDEYPVPTAFYYEGTELVSFASGTEAEKSFIAMSGGPGHSTSHDHLDSGAVVVDMKGERVLWDLGAEHYNAAGYYSDNRHLFFKARPEAHNIFIINPANTKDGINPYYGQNINADSKVDAPSLNLDKKIAQMNLSDAYKRDATAASRRISLDGDKVQIEDSISLKGTANDVYWNWYLKKDEASNINLTIDNAAKTATLVQNGKQFLFKFETEQDIEIYEEPAGYYVDVDPDPDGKKHPIDSYVRLVVHITGASGNVACKTVIE